MPVTQLTEEEKILQSPIGPVRTHTDFLKRVILERNYGAGKCFLHFGGGGGGRRARHEGGWDKACINQEGRTPFVVLNADQIFRQPAGEFPEQRALPGLSLK